MLSLLYRDFDKIAHKIFYLPSVAALQPGLGHESIGTYIKRCLELRRPFSHKITDTFYMDP